MKLDALKDILISRKSILGLTLLYDDGKITSHLALVLEKRKGEVQIVKSFEGSGQDFSDIRSFSDHPIVVSICGSSVIQKWLPNLDVETDVTSQVIPGALSSEFYSQVVRVGGGVLLSLVRLSIVEEVLSYFSANQLVVDVRLGSFSFSELLDDLLPEEVHGMGECLRIEAGAVVLQPSTIETSYSVDGVTFTNREVGSLMAGMSWLAVDESETTEPLLIKARENQKYKTLIKRLGSAIILFLLVTLLANYFVSEALFSEYEMLVARDGNSQEEQKQLERLQEKYDRDIAISRLVSLGHEHSFSRLADEIAMTVPEHIQLVGLSFNPVTRSRDLNRRVLIAKDLIEISGESDSESEISSWVRILHSTGSYKSVELWSIVKNGRTGLHEFQIRLRL